MAFALIDHTGGSSNPTATINSAGADLLIALLNTVNNPEPPDFSDSKSNTWNGLTVQTGAFSGKMRLWWSKPTSVGSGHTILVPGGNTPALFFAAFSGAHASPFDQQNGTSTPANPTVQPGSITPSEDNCLVITGGGVYTSGGSGPTVASPYTLLDGLAGAGGVTWGGALAYNIQTTATATNPIWTSPNSDSIIAVIASFKAAGGAPPPASNYGKLIFRNRLYV